MIEIILARDSANGIGLDGKMPWHLSDDLKLFREITRGKILIMGRKTFDSLPESMLNNENDDREFIVVSRTPTTSTKRARFTDDIDELLRFCISRPYGKFIVIGGNSVFDFFSRYCKIWHISDVFGEFLVDTRLSNNVIEHIENLKIIDRIRFEDFEYTQRILV